MRTSPWSLLVLVVVAGCREGSGNAVSSFVPIPAALAGSHGCNGADQAFGAAPELVPLSPGLVGPGSQLAAVRGEETLYLTGAGASVVRLDFGGGGPAPVETVLVAPGVVDALLASEGIVLPAALSGVAVLDAGHLVVVEETSNTLLLVERGVPDAVSFLAGQPNTDPGFADGTPAASRFAFTRPTQIVPSGDGRIFVADAGNHRVRVIEGASVDTVAGTGAPFFADGSLGSTGLDTPVGLSVACTGELLVLEAGSILGAGGHRLRSLEVGTLDLTGAFQGTATTLAGDGDDETIQGIGQAASLAAPCAPATSAGGEVYWIDGEHGILRRLDLASGLADCPAFADCVAAVAGMGAAPNFTAGGVFSLAVSAGGTLYVLDATAGELYRL